MAVVTSFIADKVVGSIPHTVTFTDTSTGSPDTWWWDFGDGEMGTGTQNPTHTYKCVGTYSVTLTAWITDGAVGTVTGTQESAVRKWSGIQYNEADAWAAFIASEEVDAGGSGTKFRFYKSAHLPARYQYWDTKATYNFNLTGYTKGDRVLILQYRHRFIVQAISCVLTDNAIFWNSNNHLGDIPIHKWCCTGGAPIHTSIQMISSPDLADEFDHAGENFELEIKNAKNKTTEYTDPDVAAYPTLFQQDVVEVCDCIQDTGGLWYQRIGEGCLRRFPNNDFGRETEYDFPVVKVFAFTSIDSYVATNFITSNDNVITRSAKLYSGIKECRFRDGWEDEKHLYIEQSNANPCNIQFVDIYADTENEE